MLGGMTIASLLMLDLKFSEIKNADDVELRSQVIRHSCGGLTALNVLLVVASLVIIYVQIQLLARGDLIARTSLNLLFGLYMPLFLLRLAVLIYASGSLVFAVARMYKWHSIPQSLMMPVYLSTLMILVGEIIGRFLFYATHIRVGI
jgi:DMSO reductase anchor subunit